MAQRSQSKENAVLTTGGNNPLGKTSVGPGKVSQGTCKRDTMCYQCYICQGNDKTQYFSQILLTDMAAFHVQHHARQTVTKSE